jgi:X-X-X-Leu-X-X-Gly heptad repeat protein
VLKAGMTTLTAGMAQIVSEATRSE